jgi:hypothetical protein
VSFHFKVAPIALVFVEGMMFSWTRHDVQSVPAWRFKRAGRCPARQKMFADEQQHSAACGWVHSDRLMPERRTH